MSNPSLPLDYDDLDDVLSALDRLPEAAEVHGHLLGCMAAGPLSDNEWLGRLVDEIQTGPLPESVRARLITLYRQTSDQLAHNHSSLDGLALRIMLPDDDTELSERVAALALWCQGFLAGYGLSPSHARGGSGGAELNEVLSDFAAISQAGLDQDGDESSEHDLFELTEYVRLAAAQLCWDARAQSMDSAVDASDPTGVDQLFRRGPLH